MNNREISLITRNAGGSTLTRVGREANLNAIAKQLRSDLNVQVKSFAQLKVSHVERLVIHWQGQGLSTRSMQNKMAHIRAALTEVGRDKFAADARLSNKGLGISGASRSGTHQSPGRTEIEKRISSMAMGPAATSRLQLELGLRAREAIQSVQSLSTWQRELSKTGLITVVHGTKGGKARVVDLRDPDAKGKAREAIRTAQEVARDAKGKLITSETLQGAARAYQRAMAEAGFIGAEASHSLRCQWAQEQYERHMETTNDRAEALSKLSLDLGHGDGRGRYCAQVYLQSK